MASPNISVSQPGSVVGDRFRSNNAFLNAGLSLHRHIMNHHWDNSVIIGPDPVGKIHWRLTRFIRSYLPWLPRDDQYVYLQGQAYWIMANMTLYDISQNPWYLNVIEKCADFIVQCQPPDGAWRHPPIRGRKGFISTVEGVWASLGLMVAYRKLGKLAYLDSALKWYKFQINHIGFQRVDGGLAANYYAHSKVIVPNVSTMLLWLTAELYQLNNDNQYLDLTNEMLHFLQYCQLDTGELPYAYPERTHFMCYQYNAFQFIDLAHYYQLTKNEQCFQILKPLAAFLGTGLTENGHCRYSCSKSVPEIHYWTAALATALRKASELGLGDYFATSEQAYSYLLTQQRSDGCLNFSEHNYVLLSDKRSYPRYLAMLLYFFLCRATVVYGQDETRTWSTQLEKDFFVEPKGKFE